MSEAKKSKGSKAKTEAAPKAKSESKSEGADTKTKAKDDAGSTAAASSSSDATSSDGAKESGTESGKSARESAGGKADAHYGYFSSVRTPAYRSGWDEIWGSRNGDGGTDGEEPPRRRSSSRGARAAKARKRRDPITVTLDLDDLPPSLKEGLVEIASSELKKSRVSYARRDKAGAIDWRITCRVD